MAYTLARMYMYPWPVVRFSRPPLQGEKICSDTCGELLEHVKSASCAHRVTKDGHTVAYSTHRGHFNCWSLMMIGTIVVSVLSPKMAVMSDSSNSAIARFHSPAESNI